MGSKYELKEVNIENRTGYYFNDIMRVIDIDFSDILLNKKSYKTYEYVLIYDTSYKTFIGSKPLGIRFDQINGFIKIYDRTRYLVLFGSGLYDTICNEIKYLISEKRCIADSINHNFNWFI